MLRTSVSANQSAERCLQRQSRHLPRVSGHSRQGSPRCCKPRGPVDCSSIGTCANTHAACNSQVPCANVRRATRSITNATCSTSGVDPVACPAIGRCSIANAQCTGNGQCPIQSSRCRPALPPAARAAWAVATADRVTMPTPPAGCRLPSQQHGLHAEPIRSARARYNYPAGNHITPITNGTGPDACISTDHYVAVPQALLEDRGRVVRPRQVSTPNDKWVGYGDATLGAMPVVLRTRLAPVPALPPVRCRRAAPTTRLDVRIPAGRSQHRQSFDRNVPARLTDASGAESITRSPSTTR